MRTIKYGGVLHPGDFIAVSNGNHISFGWYAGDGRGTLQFYYMEGPARTYKDYKDWLTWSDEQKAKNKWMSSRFANGFRLKCLWKSYINSVHKTRVMKVTNPEEIFTNKEDREIYEESKAALITLNFIQQ
jgi:hypothetical protein